MDLITHLPVSTNGFNSILTVVDCLLKFTTFIPCKETCTADDVASMFLAHIVARYGMPHKIVTNRDPQFTSWFRATLTARLGCNHALSTSHHPETNG